MKQDIKFIGIALLIVLPFVWMGATIIDKNKKINRLEFKIEQMRFDSHAERNKLFNQMAGMKRDTAELYEARKRLKEMTRIYYEEVNGNKRLKYCEMQLSQARQDQEFLRKLKALLK